MKENNYGITQVFLPAYDAGHILAMVATAIAYGKIELPSKDSLCKTK